jgi:hypothetical protein
MAIFIQLKMIPVFCCNGSSREGMGIDHEAYALEGLAEQFGMKLQLEAGIQPQILLQCPWPMALYQL